VRFRLVTKEESDGPKLRMVVVSFDYGRFHIICVEVLLSPYITRLVGFLSNSPTSNRDSVNLPLHDLLHPVPPILPTS